MERAKKILGTGRKAPVRVGDLVPKWEAFFQKAGERFMILYEKAREDKG